MYKKNHRLQSFLEANLFGLLCGNLTWIGWIAFDYLVLNSPNELNVNLTRPHVDFLNYVVPIWIITLLLSIGKIYKGLLNQSRIDWFKLSMKMFFGLYVFNIIQHCLLDLYNNFPLIFFLESYFRYSLWVIFLIPILFFTLIFSNLRNHLLQLK